jgi:succinate dehydrogenase/fumarate reductase cytochrome b subunit
MTTFVSFLHKISIVILFLALFVALFVTFFEVITPGRSYQAMLGLIYCLSIGGLLAFIARFDI